MNKDFQDILLRATGATRLLGSELIQELWSGYGQILRCRIDGAERKSVVVKHVRLPEQASHPRGWNTDLSHQRKLRSYQVEIEWYRRWSRHCTAACRVPACLALETCGDETLMVFEDLDAAGFPMRHESVTEAQIVACLRWLANFHATFMGETPEGLWEQGTYWHLATRPDELATLTDLPLKKAAAAIDAKLNQSPFQTFVHGDAKLANFCFSRDGNRVSAVDFQYVGGGCGMKDVAYFIGSCLDEEECERQESRLLGIYFQELKNALATHHPSLDAKAVEQNWRVLYPIAWTDFHRFLKGWSPGHWKIHAYSERLTRDVVAALSGAIPQKR